MSTSTPSELPVSAPSSTPPSDSPAPPRHYFLKCIPHPSTAPHDPRYHGRYVRFAGSLKRTALSSVVLTEGSPKYLRFYFDPAGKQMAGYEDRTWGFVLNGGDGGGDVANSERGRELDGGPGLVPVQMEKGGDDGFYFDDEKGTKDEHEAVLKHRYAGDGSTVGASKGWAGWVLKDSPPDMFSGNPRLFWCSSEDRDLGEDEIAIDLVREYL